MFFTRIGKVLAYLGFLYGSLRIAMGVYVAVNFETAAENTAAAKRYLAVANSGEAINEGMLYVLVAVSLGILCEISQNRKQTSPEADD